MGGTNMNENLVKRIRRNMESMQTLELLKIWQDNDKEQYSEDAFEAVKQLLEDRGEKLPPQKEGKETLATVPGIGKTEPKASKWILYWGAFLVVMTVWPLFDTPLPPGPGLRVGDFSFSRLAATSSIPMKALLVSGGVISFAICFLWYRESQTLERRGRLLYAFGGLLFMLGTFIVVVGFGDPGQHEVINLKLGGGPKLIMEQLIFPILLSFLILVPAFLLQFKRSKKK
jgi:hypothetical protein